MRDAFVTAVIECARHNSNILVITADLGFTVFERFEKEFPGRFLNVGVAEANMIGCASGLAMGGYIPIVYSIANFCTLRPFEQIRNDVCFPNHPVKIVGVGAGFAYAHAGFSHHSTDDIGVMRTMPNMTIFCPSGPKDTAECTKAMLDLPGPAYLRLSKKGEPDLPAKSGSTFLPGKATLLRTGQDIAFFGCGVILQEVLKCADYLEQNHQIRASVIDMHTLQPIDQSAILEAARQTKRLISVEEHGVTGGLGSAIAEVLSEHGDIGTKLMRCGIREKFLTLCGERQYLLGEAQLTAECLIKATLNFLKAK